MKDKVINDLNRRISNQLKIMSMVTDESLRYGYHKALEAFKEARQIVEENCRPIKPEVIQSEPCGQIFYCECGAVLADPVSEAEPDYYCSACGLEIDWSELLHDVRRI